MKKIVFAFLSLVLLSSFVFAFVSGDTMKVVGSHTKDNTNYSGIDSITYNINLNIHQGWNLIAGVPNAIEIKSNSDIQKEDIYNFLYVSEESKYIQVENPDSFMTFLKSTPMSPKYYSYATGRSSWVYSKKDGTLSYTGIFPANPLLTSGWNFVSITPEMTGKTLTQIKGSCNIEKVYLYPEDAKGWAPGIQFLDHQFDSYLEGLGMIIRVSSDCTLGSSSSVTAPPTLPIDNSLPLNSFDLTDFPKTIGSFTLNQTTQVDKDDCGNLEGQRVCVKMARVAYFNSQTNVAVHILPTSISEGKSAYISYIKSNSPGENTFGISGVYRGSESHELYWSPVNGYDLIGVQEYLYDFHSDGNGYASLPREVEKNEVVNYLLTKYVPNNV